MNRVTILKEEVPDVAYEFNLSDLQRKLEKCQYFGQVTLVFQDGRIILIREERTLKPSQFDRFI